MNILRRIKYNHLQKICQNRSISWTMPKEKRNARNTWVTTKQKPESLLTKKAIASLSTKKKYHSENQYLDLISDIVRNGIEEETRNGVTKSIIGSMMRFPLNNGQIPLLTTKKLAWKSCLKELLWFISGDTDNDTLVNQNVNIWNDNASRKFLDSRGLYHHRVGDLGPIYGYQWRFYNLDYIPLHVFPNVQNNEMNLHMNSGIDQLTNIIECLKDPNRRNSRRLILMAWNPEQIDQMALPPCHVMSQFSVLGNKLHCTMYQRSGDVGLGVPFNIASYSFLTILLAKHCGLEPGEFIHFIGNAHIYKEHEEILLEQIERDPKEFPNCDIIQKRNSINDYVFSDFRINNYKYHPVLKMNMIA
jgi:thymidylate synthase